MVDIVIIGHNEGASIPKMLDSLKHFFPDCRRIWVLDRCKDNSAKQLKSLHEEYYKTPFWWFGRKTSSARNFGLSKTNHLHDVIFVDGDRYFISASQPGTTKNDIELFSIEDDSRHFMQDYQDVYGTFNNGFYSNGLYMKRSAINKIINFQGELFDTSLQSEWGVEDLSLGDVAHHLNLTCDLRTDIVQKGGYEADRFPSSKMQIKRLKAADKKGIKFEIKVVKLR
jgi:glycosyltransferase involved in cell wall biosynthesis